MLKICDTKKRDFPEYRMHRLPAQHTRDRKNHAMHLRRKQIDLALVILFPFLATILSLFFDLNFFTATLLFYGTPALYLTLRAPILAQKSFIFVLVFTIPMAFMIEYLAIMDRSWIVGTSLFTKRLFGVVSLDSLTQGILWCYTVVLFYEYFLDHGKNKLVDPHIKYLMYGVILALIAFFYFLLTRPQTLSVPYFYLWIGIAFAVVPISAFLLQVPKAIGKYLKTASYFFVLTALTEFVGLRLGHWTFSGNHFVGWVPFFGFRIPFEEMLFFFILGSVGIVSIYEFFDDDGR